MSFRAIFVAFYSCFADFSVNSPVFHEIWQTRFQKNPNIPENFVKLYEVFQKNYLTCRYSKL